MNDALLVRGLEGFGNLLRDGQRLVEWNGSLRDAVGECGPFDQFEDEGRDAVGVLDPVDPPMCGWFSDARSWASRRKRATRSGSCVNDSGSTLSATSRLSFGSLARYTSPMPPAPSGESTSYIPSLDPEGSGIDRRRLSSPLLSPLPNGAGDLESGAEGGIRTPTFLRTPAPQAVSEPRHVRTHPNRASGSRTHAGAYGPLS